jgi:hypothetical protein
VGRLKVDREMDRLNLTLGNPEHPGCCRGYRWYCGSMLSRETSTPIEAAEEEESVKRRIKTMEQRLKQHEERKQIDIEW